MTKAEVSRLRVADTLRLYADRLQEGGQVLSEEETYLEWRIPTENGGCITHELQSRFVWPHPGLLKGGRIPKEE